jgi:hypothetical protein
MACGSFQNAADTITLFLALWLFQSAILETRHCTMGRGKIGFADLFVVAIDIEMLGGKKKMLSKAWDMRLPSPEHYITVLTPKRANPSGL